MPKNRLTPIFIILLINSSLFLVYPCKAQMIENQWIQDIEDHAYLIDLNTTAEIVVCVFPSLYGHGITDNSGKEINDIVQLGVKILNDYPLEVWDGEQTGIGKSGKDNGVLVLVALEEQQWRIEVGYGLEGEITDVEANAVAQQYLVPAFQQGNFGEGLYDTVWGLGELLTPGTQTNNSPRRIYYYESDGQPTQTETPLWEYPIFGVPLWVIIVLVVFGVFVPVAGKGRIGGGRSGGGGAGGRW